MDPLIARIVYFVLMTIAGTVWFLSLRKALHLGGKRAAEVDEPFAPFDDIPVEPEDSIDLTGEKTVRGTTESVSQKLAEAMLGTAVPGMFSTLFEITERTAERISIRKTGPLVCNQPSGMYFSDAEFTLTPAGEERVVVKYRLGFERLLNRTRTVALGLILGLGLPALLIGGGLTWFFVVNNVNPTVRWQTLQMLHIAHFLWPPFLFLSMYQTGRRHARTFISNLLSLLELATAPGQPT